MSALNFDPYRLPSGEIVQCDASATKGAAVIDFTLKGGEIVQATYAWTPQAGDIVWVEEGRFTGCILDYIEKQGGWHVCRNRSFGGYVKLKAGDAIWDGIRTRKVALYLTADEVRRRILGERIEGRRH